MNIKIEKGVPIPATRNAGRTVSEISLTLSKMKVGDSVVIPMEYYNALGSFFDTARRIKQNLSIQFARRTQKGKIRVWRTK